MQPETVGVVASRPALDEHDDGVTNASAYNARLVAKN